MNPMRTTKTIVGELMVDSQRIWRSAAMLAGYAVLVLGLAGGLPAFAQATEDAAQTNDAAAAEVLTRLGQMLQGDESNSPEDMAVPEDQAATNAAPPPGLQPRSDNRLPSSNRFVNPNRGQNDDRRSRRRSRSRSNQYGGSGSTRDYGQSDEGSQPNYAAGTNGSVASLDYSAFRIIVERNIFDPNRYPHQGPNGPRQPPKVVDSLTLVGTMSYEKGTFAFFDGTSSDYRKALKLNDLIAGYKVASITPSAVQLAAGTNEVDLRVGMQLRREEGGPWQLSGQAGSYTATPASTSTNAVASTGSDAASAGAESDIIKKLMQRRAQE
jgi:hypothetical protein